MLTRSPLRLAVVVLCAAGCAPEDGTDGGRCHYSGSILVGTWSCDDGLICVEDITTCRRPRSVGAGEPCNASERIALMWFQRRGYPLERPPVCAEGLSCQYSWDPLNLPPVPCEFSHCCQRAR